MYQRLEWLLATSPLARDDGIPSVAYVFFDGPKAFATFAHRMEAVPGVLHAKAVVADDETVFVTSANLTEAALDRNIEVGLLVRDRALAASVSTHFRGLIDRGLLHPLPAN